MLIRFADQRGVSKASSAEVNGRDGDPFSGDDPNADVGLLKLKPILLEKSKGQTIVAEISDILEGIKEEGAAAGAAGKALQLVTKANTCLANVRLDRSNAEDQPSIQAQFEGIKEKTTALESE